MAFLKSSELFTFITETTAGTFVPAVSATDVNVRMRELSWTNEVEKDNEASSYMTGYFFGSDESIIGKQSVGANYTIKVAPGVYTSGAPTPHVLTYSPLLENCSMASVSATGNAPGIWAFYPDQSKAEKTMSIARVMYDAESGTSQISQGSGAMSNYSLKCDGVATPFMVSFETKAAGQQVIEASTGVATLDESKIMRTVADSLRNTTVKITDLSTSASQSFCISTMELASGNDLQVVECQDSESGLKNYIVTKVDPSLTINPLLKTLAQFNWWTALTQEKMYKVEIDSEYVSIYIPRAQMISANVADANGFMRNEISMRPLVNLDNDYPTWISVGSLPTNRFAIPYYIGIKESVKMY